MTGGRKDKGKGIAGVSRGDCASPNIPESPASGAHHSSTRGPDTTQRIFIQPHAHNKFDRQLECVQRIGDLIEIRFEGAWKSWRKFPKDTRDLIFSEFGKHYDWNPADARAIRSIFDYCAKSCVKNRMYNLRKSKKKPDWLGEKIFEDLNQIFAQSDFKKVSDRNTKNRASDCDGQGFPLHVGGCVSHSEHIDRLTAKQGYEPSIAEAFMHLRSTTDANGNLKWVNQRAQKSHEDFTTRVSQLSSQSSNGEETLSKQEQIKIFTEVVGGPSKKGCVYGLAGQPLHMIRGSSSSITSHSRAPMEWETEREELINRINDIESTFQSKVDEAVEARIDAAVAAKVGDIEARFMEKFASFEENMRGLSVTSRQPCLLPSHPSSFYPPATGINKTTPRYPSPSPPTDNVNDIDNE